MSQRKNAFADLNSTPDAATRKPVDLEQIDAMAVDLGFPSRDGVKASPKKVDAGNRSKVGRPVASRRNTQINIKTTVETIELFYRVAKQRGVGYGEGFEQALAAWIAAGEKKGG
jgi:hypothetical protein